ncbi:SAM-dependent methyltransferase [Sciscionella marina]|uniref:SAM-dependent methyltransferase n=1 Tax=Sciscionella marina TaxID=508770 RepID=UPI000368C0DF|nr:SAM-dependent methyltransferase [Sciscionella marina]
MTQAYEEWDIVSSVGFTALMVAAARAAETASADPLITDEYAAAFVESANPATSIRDGQRGVDEEFWLSMVDYMAVRTRFFDEFLEKAGTPQVVVLAAGLDARAYRLSVAPDTRWFEVDQPKVLAFKQDVLEARGAEPVCRHHMVGTDLREDWVSALRAAGFDPELPTAWLAEGLLMYLPAQAEDQLFARIDELSAPGSMISVEDAGALATGSFIHDERVADASEQFGVSFADLVSQEERADFAEFLSGKGWSVEPRGIEAIEQGYGRHIGGRTRDLLGGMRIVNARR